MSDYASEFSIRRLGTILSVGMAIMFGTLLWARIPGDLVFTVGVTAFALFMVRALFVRGKGGAVTAAPVTIPVLVPVA